MVDVSSNEDGEDELEALVRQSSSQGRGPQHTGQGGLVNPRPPSIQESFSELVQPSSSGTSDVLFQKAMIAITQLANNAAQDSNSESLRQVLSLVAESQKRKREDVLEEEEPKMLDEMVHVRDDATTVFDMSIRQRLKNPNAEPSEWFTAAVERVSRPVIGQGMVLTHLMPGRINPKTIRKIHDRGVLVTTKSLATHNSGVTGEKKTVYRLQENGEDDALLLGSKNYVDCKTIFEVVESVLNYAAVVHQVRPFSYEGLALIRCLHHVKFFFGATEDPKTQKTLLEKFISEIMTYNQRRASERKYPATFKKALEIAKVSILWGALFKSRDLFGLVQIHGMCT